MPVLIKRSPDFKAIADRLHREDLAALADAQRMSFRAVQSRYKGPTSPTSLSRRTGALSGGVKVSPLFERSGRLEMRVYMEKRGDNYDPVYARIHELGGTILPKRGQYLAIPLPSLRGRTAAGKFSLGPRDFPDGFFFRSRAGNLIFGVREGKGRIRALFVMKERVTIPKRPVWALSRAEVRPLIMERYRVALRNAVRG